MVSMNVRIVCIRMWNFIVNIAISDLGIQTMFINESIQTTEWYNTGY